MSHPVKWFSSETFNSSQKSRQDKEVIEMCNSVPISNSSGLHFEEDNAIEHHRHFNLSYV